MVNTTLLPLSYYFGIFGSLNNNPIRSLYFSAYVTRLILEFFFSSSGINLGTFADQTLYLVSTFDVGELYHIRDSLSARYPEDVIL